VGGGLDTHGRLPLPAPTSTPWEWGKGCRNVSLSLRGGSGPNDPPARKLADALDTIPKLQAAMDSHLHRWLSCRWS
jgi:hypothetical protein